MKHFLRLIKSIKQYWGYVLLNFIFNVLSIAFSLVSMSMVAPFLGLLFGKIALTNTAPPLTFNANSIIQNFYYIISKIIKTYGQADALLFICILVVVMFFLKNLFRYMGMYYLANIRNGVVKDLRNSLYYKILILPLSYFSEQKKGDIMSRMTSDVQEVEWSIMTSLEMVFRDPLTILVYLITLTLLSPQLTIFVLILLPVSGFIIGRIGKSLKKQSIKGQRRLGELLSIIEESLSGLRIIKAFNAIDILYTKFLKKNSALTNLMIKMYRRRDLSAPMSEFLGTLVMVIVMLFGGHLVLAAHPSLSAEIFITYIVIFSQIITPAKSFSTAFYNIQKGIASAERIYEILDAKEIIEEKTNALSINKFSDSIEYQNVTFVYEKEEVLKKINIKIEKGKTIALVGQSGGGKSTFADLLPRFYDCVSGNILIDGQPIDNYKIDDLRGLMGIVTQESILFNGTVLSNIAFGQVNVKEEEVIAAAKVANAHEFIMDMENGYYTNIGDRGVKLSGGQRQRISIARAVLKNPPILILDEATSALDSESEKLVQDAILKLMKNRTSIIIAHRLSTIQHADQIVVLQKGEIIERGTHAELMSLNGTYKKLHDMQTFE
ncbi:MAG: ABC transporter ATP-binding protein [Bacteroidota bacterium]|nr:ABC transporter ATP-binding protein [Bacteroidota bacterium]